MHEPLPVSLSKRARPNAASSSGFYINVSTVRDNHAVRYSHLHQDVVTSDILKFLNSIWVEPGSDYLLYSSRNRRVSGHHAGSCFSFCLIKCWMLRLPTLLLLPVGPKVAEGTARSRTAACQNWPLFVRGPSRGSSSSHQTLHPCPSALFSSSLPPASLLPLQIRSY